MASAGVTVYFSGCRRWLGVGGEKELHESTKWTHRCFSFHYTGKAKSTCNEDVDALDYCLKNGVKVMLDSGAHTFLAKTVSIEDTGVAAYLDEYKAYLKRHKKKFTWVANFDFQKRAPVIYDVWQSLRKEGFDTVPVYHGDSDLSWVDRYADAGVKLIGIGKPVSHKLGGRKLRPFYDATFDRLAKRGMRAHGFAVTGQNMYLYPWESVDSTTWLMLAKQGLICLWNVERHRLQTVPVSLERKEHGLPEGSIWTMPKAVQKQMDTTLRRSGFTLKQVSGSGFYRAAFNASQLIAAASNPRGVKWKSLI